MRVPLEHFLDPDFVVHQLLGDRVIVIPDHLDCIKPALAVPGETDSSCTSFADSATKGVLYTLNNQSWLHS